ncbi:hypothetical protein [Streptomyces qinglanensis]|uniref:hypothetical protein n=1 Tax=Streptomyces qinglanensis TaxID=943816 RepID=UPI0037B23193
MSTDQSPETEDRPAPRSRRRRLSVAAVATAVLLAGGGGAYWASSASSGGADSESAAADGDGPPKLALDGTAASDQDSGEGIAPGEPMGPRGYRAEGELPDGPDSAAVRKPGHRVSRAEAARLAKAFEIEGAVEAEAGRWQAGGDSKGKDPRLTVERGADGGAWTYQNGGTVPLDADPDPAPGGEPLSAADAKKAVRPALRALGLQDASLDAGSPVGGTRTVTASPEVAGLPTHGWDSTFVVDDKGAVTRAQGNWSRARKGEVYPVESATATLDRLNKAEQARGGHREGAQGNEPTRIGGASFGLALERSHGEPLLVPAWIYQVKRSGGGDLEVTHPAVSPEYLEPAKTSGHPPVPDGSTGPGKRPSQAVASYEVHGRTLELSFWGGVCDTYKAEAEESGSAVRVSVEAGEKKGSEDGKGDKGDKDGKGGKDGKGVCVKIAKRQTVEVELDKKLGDRRVLDARNGEKLPKK